MRPWRCEKKSLPRIQRDVSHCLESAKFVDYRQTTLTSLFGDVVYERVYYHCPHCHAGWFPMDEELGVSDPKDQSGGGSDGSGGHRRAVSAIGQTVVEKAVGTTDVRVHGSPHDRSGGPGRGRQEGSRRDHRPGNPLELASGRPRQEGGLSQFGCDGRAATRGTQGKAGGQNALGGGGVQSPV